MLPLSKRHPQLYHKACSQPVPKVFMDYLTISRLVGLSKVGLDHALAMWSLCFCQ